jgi:uncharacterized protein DUF5676
MKLDAINFGNAGALAIGILWIVCTSFFIFFPEFSLKMSGSALHLTMTDITLDLSMKAFVMGLICWVTTTWITLWLIATIYNRLIPSEES